jgi:hypothetical protein
MHVLKSAFVPAALRGKGCGWKALQSIQLTVAKGRVDMLLCFYVYQYELPYFETLIANRA